MANDWLRLYAEFADDPKVQIMPEHMQRRLIMLFCERCSDVLVTLHETELAFHWRISEAELAETKALFIAKGFIDGEWNLTNWNKRQFVSDSSSDRTRRYRERKRTSQERHGNEDVTKCDALDTDTDTDTEKEISSNPPDCDPSADLSLDTSGELRLNDSEDQPKVHPEDRPEGHHEDRERVESVFAYYLERTGKSRSLYSLTPKRMTLGLRRFRECKKLVAEPVPENAELAMRAAVDGLVESAWHRGENPDRKKYLDWDQNLFRSFEQMERWYGRVLCS